MITDDTCWKHLTKQPPKQKVTQPAIECVRNFKSIIFAFSVHKLQRISEFNVISFSVHKLQRISEFNVILHEKNLLQMKTFCGLKCSVTPHSSLNTSKGIIRCPALSRVTSDDIKEGMVEQGVTDVRRITVRRDGETKLTNTYVLTFNSPNLPTVVKIGFLQVKVDVYIPNPLRCYHCQVFGHHENKCGRHAAAATAVTLNIVHHLACVTNQPNVSTAQGIILQTQSNAHNGRKRRKFSKSNLKTIYHFLMLVSNTNNFTLVKPMQVL